MKTGLQQLRDVVNQALSHIPLTAAPTITVLYTRAKYDIHGCYFFVLSVVREDVEAVSC
jgi:hypothetical protein